VGAKVPLDEGNVNSMIFNYYHVGFYLWLASLTAVGLGAIVVWIITWQRVRDKLFKIKSTNAGA
jgi:hypothetical protein